MEGIFAYDLNRLQVLDKIGEGQFGEVYKVKEKATGMIYAAKISINFFEGDEIVTNIDEIRNIVREVNIISNLNHPSIVKFIGFNPKDFQEDPRPVIITEYIPNGSLRDLIESERSKISDIKWNDTQKLIMLYGIASAMSYLHSHKILHRDLKPENILIDENYYPKIADFGLSKIYHQNKESITNESAVNFKGTLLYSSPEVVFECDYSTSADVYSFSIIAYEIMTSESPFGELNAWSLVKKLGKQERPIFDKPIKKSYRSLIEKCWSQDKFSRPTFDEIVHELRSNRDFITDTVDEKEFQNYVDFVDEFDVTFGTEKVLSIDEYLERKKLFENFTKYYYGNGVSVDKKKAAEYCKMAADKGSISAMKNYGNMLYNGDAIAANKIESVRYFKMAADCGDTSSMKMCVMLLYNGGEGIKSDKKEAAKYCKMLADKGDVTAMHNYAGMLYNGDGVSVDKSGSAVYFRMAADSGDVESMRTYGNMLKAGDGVKSDKKEAARYLKMAADRGDPVAMNSYAGMLFMGVGVPQNKEEGIRYCKMAADNGHLTSMVNYAALLEAGDGVAEDKKEAARLYKLAADRGHVGAMDKYAVMLYNGIGVAADKKEALKYHNLAVSKK